MRLTTARGNPPVDALRPPPNGATPARKSARYGAGAGFPRPHRPRPRNTGNGAWLPAPRDGRLGEGKRLTPDTAHNGEDDLPPPRRRLAPRRARTPNGQCRAPTPHTRAHSTRAPDPDCPPRGRAAGGGRAPDPRRPSQRREAPPPGRPPATPTARNAGSQERTMWGRC